MNALPIEALTILMTTRNEPIKTEKLFELQTYFKCIFPEDYAQLLLVSDGMFVNYDILLYSSEEIIERNETYETEEYFPGWLLIGNDGGDSYFYLDTTLAISPVFVLGSGCPFKEDARQVAANIAEWIEIGFDYHDPRDHSDIGKVDIYLNKIPDGGMKNLLQIKQLFNLTWSAAQLLNGAKNLPVKICSDVYFSKYRMAYEKMNESGPCLYLTEVGSNTGIEDE